MNGKKVEKVTKLLKVFNVAINIILDSDYPTINLYLVNVFRIKQVLDGVVTNESKFILNMAKIMKVKFDKYWSECSLVMYWILGAR